MTRAMLICSLVSVSLCGQTSPQRPSFEVTSVKLNISGEENGSILPGGNRFVARNVTLDALIRFAYTPLNEPLLANQLSGLPAWGRADRFDVEAVSREEIGRDNAKEMLQALLEERFQLKIHNEMRSVPVYNLVLSKGGPKLSIDQSPIDPRQSRVEFSSDDDGLNPPRGTLRIIAAQEKTILRGNAVPVSRLATILQGRSDRLIVDKTEISSLIDVRLEFGERLSAGPLAATQEFSETSLFSALQEIGLKLQTATAMKNVLLIDSVQRPSAN